MPHSVQLFFNVVDRAIIPIVTQLFNLENRASKCQNVVNGINFETSLRVFNKANSGKTTTRSHCHEALNDRQTSTAKEICGTVEPL